MAVLHYPVYNKNREIVATCLSSYDLHDISRTARCYNIGKLYFINPMDTQHVLAGRIIKHWIEGYGASYNPTRQQALQTVALKKSLAEVKDDIALNNGCPPKIVVTSSKNLRPGIDYNTLSSMIQQNEQSYLIIFGTGWGLAEHVIQEADYFLEPIMGDSDFNHLSVRCATAIVMDRLLGNRTNGGTNNA